MQAELLDGMELGPDAVVVLHVGGAAGGEEAAIDRFLHGFELLSDAARARLVVENDDRTFGLRDVLELSSRIGVPSCGTSCTTTATTRIASPTARRSSWRSGLAAGRAAEDPLLVAADRRRGAQGRRVSPLLPRCAPTRT